MLNRWKVLGAAFRGEDRDGATVSKRRGAGADAFRHDLDVGIADIGLLIGLYLSPGLVLALPGGAIGKRYGDKLVVMTGLALMTVGGLIMTFSLTWHLELLGRLLAGVGGVLLNVC